MSEINWDDNAKAAVREFYRWANARFKSGCSVDADVFLKEFTTRPQQKTVADAYEAFTDGWPESLELPLGKGWWFNSNGELVWIEQHLTANKLTVVCNQLEFEAYVKEQECEKWTHETAESEYCRILIDEPDQFGNVVILKEEWGYSDYPLSSLKPIKPKLTESQYDSLVEMAAHFDIEPEKFNEYLSSFEIKLNK